MTSPTKPLSPVTAPDLAALPGIAHAFFTREGGVSDGIYASLNGGLGSADETSAITVNRSRMAATLGVTPANLISVWQVHSPDVAVVSAPWPGDRPKADAMVSRTPGMALGIATADCGPLLFADAQARVVGAAHSGWKGAFTGIFESTLVAMEQLGADRRNITAVLGPMIGPTAYEVGPEFVARIVAEDAGFQRFFAASPKDGHAMFDLPAFIGMKAEQSMVGCFVDLGLCTYSDPQRFYSYRRTTHAKEPDYGRLISAIALV
ncbi:MAG: peptidoglycan editing factor PgeF [Bosea sp. (in: a-proteobacteria)]